MIERNEDVAAKARELLADKHCRYQYPKRCEAIEIALHAYEASPTAHHYDHLWGLVQTNVVRVFP